MNDTSQNTYIHTHTRLWSCHTDLYEVVQVAKLAHIGDSLLLGNVLKDLPKVLGGL